MKKERFPDINKSNIYKTFKSDLSGIKLRICILIILFLLVNCFHISPLYEKQAFAAKKTNRHFKGVQREILDNGLTVITLEKTNIPLVSINIFVNTGSINENEHTTGISHFCEHLFYRGTEKRTGIQMKKEIEMLGGIFNAETSKDYTRFYVNIPSQYGFNALEIYCDAIKNASYMPECIEQERKVIIEEYNLTRESPMFIIQENLYSMAFSEHPYNRSVIGTKESIEGFRREDFLRYKETFYSPENLVIVIVGDFNREKYIKFIRSFFKDMPGGVRSRDNHYANIPLEKTIEKIDKKKYPMKKAIFTMAYRSPGIKDFDDVLAADLLIFMLGQGENSILNREICRKKRIVDSIAANYLTSKDPGLIVFSSEVPSDKIDSLKTHICDILSDIKQGKFTEKEMNQARKLLVKTYIYGLETNDGKADALGFYEILGDMEYGVDYIDRINKLTKEDVINVANKYFGQEYVVYIMEPAPKEDEEED
ncbi:MAG: insulinase family protein [Candidatus Eremiobacteraeota bacterium]|nr:insulinase family protein [Candidatus Eremiobacteraeota bacterium]